MFHTEIEEKLSDLNDVKEEDLNLAFDELNMSIQKLQKFVSDSVLFLPSYNLQSSQQVVYMFFDNKYVYQWKIYNLQ